MINVLIVDDEAVIREGIIKSIDWSSYDINISGEASNGKEALEIAQSSNPDIVIADIRMPVMDGLEFSRRLKSIMPSVKLVILTGYSEFEYAKKAIEFKVSEFILKPVGAEELIRIILKLKDEIIYERKKNKAEKSKELLLRENLPVIRGRLIDRLVSGLNSTATRDEVLERAQTLNMDFSGPLYQIFIIAIDDYFFHIGNQPPERRKLILDAVFNVAEEALLSYTRGFLCRNEIGLFIGMANIESHAFDSIAMCRHIQLLISKHLKMSISIGIGNEKYDLLSVHESYNEAFNALRERVYRGKGIIVHANEIMRENASTGSLNLASCIEEGKELLLCLKLIDRCGINVLLDRLFKKLISAKIDFSNIKNTALKLLLSAFRGMEEMGIDIEGQPGLRLDLFQDIGKYETADGVRMWMKDIIEKLVVIIENEKNEKYKGIVKVAIDYIMKHYDEPLSLTAVAESVYVTPSYLSRIFKEETGESFIEWLNKYRIEKAKEFLADISLKTYEVAEKVGFNDYKHFSYNFKKYIGTSLTEYRELRVKG